MIYKIKIHFQWGLLMYSEKFLKFIEMWQKDFAIERTIDEKVCIDRDGNPIPWYTYPAIEYLSQFDYSQKEIFEFGCGNSSLFWANRAQFVTSIEDNTVWYEKWIKEFHKDNLDIRWRDEGEDYYNAVFEDKKKYDVIIIDGKRRADCAQTAIKALNSGGLIILDDSDRINTSLEYRNAVSALKSANLLQVDFYGFCPMNNYTKTTSVFFSRNFNFVSKYEVQPINGLGNLWSMERKKRKALFKD